MVVKSEFRSCLFLNALSFQAEPTNINGTFSDPSVFAQAKTEILSLASSWPAIRYSETVILEFMMLLNPNSSALNLFLALNKDIWLCSNASCFLTAVSSQSTLSQFKRKNQSYPCRLNEATLLSENVKEVCRCNGFRNLIKDCSVAAFCFIISPLTEIQQLNQSVVHL